MNRGRHLYSAGRPLRRALVHISSNRCIVLFSAVHCSTYEILRPIVFTVVRSAVTKACDICCCEPPVVGGLSDSTCHSPQLHPPHRHRPLDCGLNEQTVQEIDIMATHGAPARRPVINRSLVVSSADVIPLTLCIVVTSAADAVFAHSDV